jgi:hypothetical protein
MSWFTRSTSEGLGKVTNDGSRGPVPTRFEVFGLGR